MKIFSVFPSIDGEVNHFHQGRLTTFIRFAGCNLHCAYCDTEHAQDRHSGIEMTTGMIIGRVAELGIKKVTITGGEPLMQKEGFCELVEALNWKGYDVSVETNGSYKLIGLWFNCWVVDWKLPSSGMEHHMHPSAYKDLRPKDFVKFVISDEGDFERALEVRGDLRERGCRAQFAFSPVYGVLDVNLLITWLIGKGVVDAVVNIQLHKVLGIRESM